MGKERTKIVGQVRRIKGTEYNTLFKMHILKCMKVMHKLKSVVYDDIHKLKTITRRKCIEKKIYN